jgi:hypothetical protein
MGRGIFSQAHMVTLVMDQAQKFLTTEPGTDVMI